MTIDLLAVVGLANTALDVAQKTEKYAPHCLKPLAQAALQMADEMNVLRSALDNLRSWVEDAWDDHDEGGSYKTNGFEAAIAQADAALDATSPVAATTADGDQVMGSMPKGFPFEKSHSSMPIVQGATCCNCHVVPGNPHWKDCFLGEEEKLEAVEAERSACARIADDNAFTAAQKIRERGSISKPDGGSDAC